MSELEQYISSTFGIDRNDLSNIANLFHKETLKKGDYFLKSGNYSNKLSFIQSGLLRIYVQYEDKEVTQWISSNGYFVCDLASLMFRTPARWNIQAITDVSIYSLSDDDYRNIGKLIPQWHELEKLFIARCFILLEERILSHLSMTAEERYHAFYNKNKELFQQVPQQYIASMLGMSAETFSRIRNRIK